MMDLTLIWSQSEHPRSNIPMYVIHDGERERVKLPNMKVNDINLKKCNLCST